MTTTVEPTSALCEGFVEDEEAERTRALGLRPTHYSTHADGHKGSYPDQRGCPAWCWVAAHPEYDHEVTRNDPMNARHAAERVSTVASQYQGEYHSVGKYGDPDHLTYVSTATVETELQQRGQDQPVIKISLRHYPDGKRQELTTRLRLSVDDARELAIVLSHFAEEAGRA